MVRVTVETGRGLGEANKGEPERKIILFQCVNNGTHIYFKRDSILNLYCMVVTVIGQLNSYVPTTELFKKGASGFCDNFKERSMQIRNGNWFTIKYFLGTFVLRI